MGPTLEGWEASKAPYVAGVGRTEGLAPWRRYQNAKAARMPRSTVPPTTPPAMAPALDDLLDDLADAEGEGEAVGEDEVADDDDVDDGVDVEKIVPVGMVVPVDSGAASAKFKISESSFRPMWKTLLESRSAAATLNPSPTYIYDT